MVVTCSTSSRTAALNLRQLVADFGYGLVVQSEQLGADPQSARQERTGARHVVQTNVGRAEVVALTRAESRPIATHNKQHKHE